MAPASPDAITHAPTGIEQGSDSHLPLTFSLSQNYPNPFNPTTAISYQLKAIGSPIHTTLKIYNILGQEVKTLVDEEQEAGHYTATWDGRNEDGASISSGIYFYRIEAGRFVQTRKMLLLR
jgi:flagellar hook assembly protein FlgD